MNHLGIEALMFGGFDVQNFSPAKSLNRRIAADYCQIPGKQGHRFTETYLAELRFPRFYFFPLQKNDPAQDFAGPGMKTDLASMFQGSGDGFQ